MVGQEFKLLQGISFFLLQGICVDQGKFSLNLTTFVITWSMARNQ